MLNVSLKLDGQSAVFLCQFFGGQCIGAERNNDKERYLLASSNYRKIYKLLTVDQKKEVIADIEMVKTDPHAACDALTEFLNFAKDNLL